MQLMAERSLGARGASGARLDRGRGGAANLPTGLKVPHMGWNPLAVQRQDHPVLAAIPPGAHAYFVHSYAMACAEGAADVAARTEYGGPLVAVGGAR